MKVKKIKGMLSGLFLCVFLLMMLGFVQVAVDEEMLTVQEQEVTDDEAVEGGEVQEDLIDEEMPFESEAEEVETGDEQIEDVEEGEDLLEESEEIPLPTPISWDAVSDIPSLIEEDDPNFPDFHYVATAAQLGAAVSGAPTNGNIRVINITSNLAFAATAPTAANGRDITAGRNIVIQSNVGVDLTATTVRHFNVTGASSRLIINRGITIRRVAAPGTTVATGVGGGITLASGTLRLNGGFLHGLATNTNTGAAVHQTGGLFEMFAGEIAYNRNNHTTIGAFGATARSGGAGVRMTAGTFNFHGGMIYQNRTPGSGGAILISSNASTMNMFGGLITDNMNGGGGPLEGSSPGSSITGQGAGALGITGGGNFNMFGGEFRDNFTVGTGGDGGAIESGSSVAGAAGRNNIQLFGGKFIGNIGRQGGAINNHHNSDLLLADPHTVPTTNVYGYMAVQPYLATGVIFEDNTGRGSGGAIVQRGDTATITMNSGLITHNQSTGTINEGGFPAGSGGGIFLNNGTMTMTGGVIAYNEALNNIGGVAAANTLQGGGGIYIGAGTTLTMDHGTIRHNETGMRPETAAFTLSGGGGVHNRGTFHFNGGEISDNISAHTAVTSGGGGIHLGAGTFTMGQVQIRNNRSVSGGGGIDMVSTGTLMMTDGIITGNRATRGAGINVTPALTTTAAATITAAGTAMPTLNITGGVIGENHADEPEGEQVNFAPSRIVPSPTTAGNGLTLPANVMTIGGTANINGNVHYGLTLNTTRAGAGAFNVPVQTVTIGGAAMITGALTVAPTLTSAGAGTATRTLTFTLNVTDGGQVLGGLDLTPILTQNRSAGTTAFNNNVNVNVTNQSTVSGGVILAPQLSTISTGTTAFHQTNTFLFTMSETSTITNGIDVLPELSHTGGTGGTAANSSRTNVVEFNLLGGNIRGGAAKENGGALHYQPLLNAAGGAAATVRANHSRFNLNGGTIASGVATNNGGGVYHHPNSQITGTGQHHIDMNLNHVTIENNQAGHHGGGIYMDVTTTGGTTPTPTLNMSGGSLETNRRTISHNRVGGNGGGIYLSERLNGTPSGFTNSSLTNATIESNEAAGHGGGIYVATPTGITDALGTLHITNTSMNRNTSTRDGASMWIPHVANLTIEHSQFNGNITETGSGGGIYFAPIGTNNPATRQLTLNHTTISNNQALEGNGGGIFTRYATLNLNPFTTISENKAYLGGGVYLDEETSLTGNETIFLENRAIINGGGVYVSENAQLTLTDSNLTQNHANYHGGAIFTENYEYFVAELSPMSYLNLAITNGHFNENTAGIGHFSPPELNGQTIDVSHVSFEEVLNPINNADINFEAEEVEIETFEFAFIKMNSDFTENLAGAQFELQADTHQGWAVTHVQTSDEYGQVTFTDLIPGVYRLIETHAPSGYRTPSGFWHLVIDESGEVAIVAQGDLLPAFKIENDTYMLGNMHELDLPILGGLGDNQTLVFAGMALILASGTLVLLVKRRRNMYF